MEIDVDKQFVDDESEFAVEQEIVKEVENPFVKTKDLTQYGLVAKVARNGIVLLWEWMPLEQARIEAKQMFEDMM